MTIEIPFGGYVAPGYEPVMAAFKANFEAGKELGAGYAAYVDGVCKVDIFGGYSDEAKTVPFTNKSLTTIWSSGKSVSVGQKMGVTICHLVSEGLISLDDPVIKYWPEFGAGGKDHVLIKDLCHHTAGVASLDKENIPTIEDLSNLDVLAQKIAKQPHNFGGEYVKQYHAITQGWYLNEIVRRVLGKSHGQFLKEVVNPKLGVEIYCGMPVDDETVESRYSPVVFTKELMEFLGKHRAAEGTPRWKSAMTMPSFTAGPNDQGIRKGESPAAYSVSNASSVAKLMAVCSMGGSLDGVKLADKAVIQAAAELDPKASSEVDLSLRKVTRTCAGGVSWSRTEEGYVVPSEYPPAYCKGEGWEWTGWYGFGGSHAQFSLPQRTSSAYVMNLMQPMGGLDNRGTDLALALTKCVDAERAKN
ncbi:hypothetical protein HDU93_000239 [Gonapodya sp. JEL0774]|nr:hypothetical protein HDU93_000239 [Gonapodya sp. JEL0774]